MIVTFCGHSKAHLNQLETDLLKTTLNRIILENNECIFYLGGYGNFDFTCLHILLNLKNNYPHIKLVFVTPYLLSSYTKLKEAIEIYDETVYPTLEKTPIKFAIEKRNKWMVDNCNLLICYINTTFGGAYKTYKYAKSKNIQIINVCVNN